MRKSEEFFVKSSGQRAQNFVARMMSICFTLCRRSFDRKAKKKRTSAVHTKSIAAIWLFQKRDKTFFISVKTTVSFPSLLLNVKVKL